MIDVEQLRKKIRELNRRCQRAESALVEEEQTRTCRQASGVFKYKTEDDGEVGSKRV